MKDTILVVDDEKSVRVLLRELLENEAYSVYEAGSLSELTAFLQNMVPDIVILDLGLPDGSGIEIIPAIKEKCKNTEVIVITAMGTVDNAVDSMKLGAYDFITKPFDTRKIRRSVERALNYVKVRRENMALKLQQKNHLYYEEFIGECTQIQELNKLVHKLAFADVPILITGETGTGKNIL
ncbi:MAG: sigma-54-dependent Fis family transcriptional regulator, partial [Spirochaetales bacterium]